VRFSTRGHGSGRRRPGSPTTECKPHRAVGFCPGGPWGFGKVAPWSLRALRRRSANAASTSQHPVRTRKSARLRTGLWRYRDEARTRGSWRQRPPRSARPWLVSPSSRARGGRWGSSSALVARRPHRWGAMQA